MPACKDCMNYTSISAETGECQINGSTFPDRDTERCPAKTFRLRIEEPKQKIAGKKKGR
jgi:hypothetical protein